MKIKFVLWMRGHQPGHLRESLQGGLRLCAHVVCNKGDLRWRISYFLKQLSNTGSQSGCRLKVEMFAWTQGLYRDSARVNGDQVVCGLSYGGLEGPPERSQSGETSCRNHACILKITKSQKQVQQKKQCKWENDQQKQAMDTQIMQNKTTKSMNVCTVRSEHVGVSGF